ncbi:YigZ family protein [Marinococcus sp. PL1-022]|uniref:YigZ family protein n=1 Tax=Marinococcus sp. PL1-022 TaxID=3095363 RepID=UPI0029C269FB|nr:YigZ family protein [Marinococcus sp. PL1-022]MDX6151694.1 YigZ family protein [Marinococcus sp. PL1-022]
MLTSYRTIKQSGHHEFTINKSRFITHITRAADEVTAHSFIEQIKKEHWNAAHNCSAYLIGEQDHIQKANDDGEPNGTAGVPMLEVLKKRELKDTAVVVTRYFGGIKLGAGGLIRAYGSSVSEALNHIGIVRRTLMQELVVSADYSLLGKLEYEARKSAYILDTIDYEEQVKLHLYTPVEEVEACQEWLVNISSGQAGIEEGKQAFVEADEPS